MKTFHKPSTTFCNYLFKLEKTGRYDEAFSELEGIWSDKTKLPEVDGLDSNTAAEIILRCGSLISSLGHQKQLPNAQEKAKNLLTEARKRFRDIYNTKKIAECENYMALAYWRSGELPEAEDWIAETFSHNIPISDPVILYTLINQSTIFLSGKRYAEVIEKLENLELVFLKYADDFLKGSFYNNIGVALDCLGKINEALTKLEKGKDYYRKSGNKFQYAIAENNLSMLYKAQKNFPKAHESSDNATKIFKKIKDRTREGCSLDTKAQIYLAEENYPKALQTIEKAIKIVHLSENASLVTEAYLTKAKTLIYLDKIADATACLFEAVELAKIQSGEKAAEHLISEYETVLRAKFEKNAYITANQAKVVETDFENSESQDEQSDFGENLELILPPSIAGFKEIQAIQIRNKHLEFAGLEKGSLAIVAETTVNKGDLAAIVVLKNDAVICGFYDEDFGIVCLESESPDPMLFDRKDIEILGKIVGFGKPDKSMGNKLVVKSLIK